MSEGPIVEQALLEKLERLTLEWQKSLPGLIGGRKPSRFSGPGLEFLDHRNFSSGDDLRSVNWRAYLRLEKLFLKMFQVEPRVPVRMLLDLSDSMNAGDQGKLLFTKRLAAALCYVGLVRLDSIALQPFRDRLDKSYMCTGGRHRFLPAAKFIADQKPGGRTAFHDIARQFVSEYPQRGLLVIFSDFLGEDPERPLQQLASIGHELMLVHVWSPQDREPDWSGDVELVDAETGQHLKLAVDDDSRAAYTASFDKHCRRLQELAERNGGRYIGLSTATELEEALFTSFIRAGGVQ